jgi:SAM-dependent methyltransferase
MTEVPPYDAFADIYEHWTATAPATAANLPYYVERSAETEGPVVELGVGDGRIAVEAARRAKSVIGIDSSGVTLIQADFRDFALPEPAGLIAIPFHTIGHMVSHDDKRACIEHVRGQLAPGGRLVFDHFVIDLALARSRDSIPVLRATWDRPGGGEVLMWSVTSFDSAAHSMDIRAITEEVGPDGVIGERRVRALPFSWIEPAEAEQLLVSAGFEIEARFGDFEGTRFEAESRHQVWVARKPEA